MQSPPAAPPPSRLQMLGLAVAIAVVAPNLAALAVPFEDFPYSSAPMFAHYVSDDTPRYRFRFIAEPRGDGAEWEIQARDVGYRNVDFGRFFFGSVYGAAGSGSPYGRHRHEGRDAFEARLAEFFERFTAMAERELPPERAGFQAIRLEIVRLDADNYDTVAHEVGRYVVDGARFHHTWEPQP